MCVTHVKTYVHPNGELETVERDEFCPRSNGDSPCRTHTRRKHPDQLVASSSAMASPSLVDDDDGPTSSSGSAPSTPPQIEMREPGGHRRKGKAKRTINPQEYHVQFSSSRRTDEPSPRARFADDERSHATVQPKTPSPPRRGREETPAPSSFRTPAPSGRGSPLNPSMRRAQPEVHQPDPPSPRPRRPVPSRSRRSPTESTETRGSSSSRTGSTDADVYTRPEHRARARESHQRQERERRREEEEDRRRRQEQEEEEAEAERVEARARAEDEHSLREYRRINAREAIRQARRRRSSDADQRRTSADADQRRTSADADQWQDLEDRVNVLLEKAREHAEHEQVERIAKEIRERRERIRDDLRREAEAEPRPRDEHRHDAERRREVNLQEAVSQMSTRGTDEDGANTAEEIRRITNDIELQREARRQQEREEDRRELRRIELIRIKALEDEIRHLERELRPPADAHYPDHRAEYQQQRNSWPYYHYHGPWHNYAPPPQIPLRTLPPYPTGWPGNGLPMRPRNLYEDPHYRRARGERVLQQERAMANVRDNNHVAIMSGGLHRRNTLGGGGREREMAYRYPVHYPWWLP